MKQKDKTKKNQLQCGIDHDLESAEIVCRKVSGALYKGVFISIKQLAFSFSVRH